jgi:hypothetical protein
MAGHGDADLHGGPRVGFVTPALAFAMLGVGRPIIGGSFPVQRIPCATEILDGPLSALYRGVSGNGSPYRGAQSAGPHPSEERRQKTTLEDAIPHRST